jgi:hypothetical protein
LAWGGSLTIIEKVNEGDHAKLAKREVYWQNAIRFFVQNGGGGLLQEREVNFRFGTDKIIIFLFLSFYGQLIMKCKSFRN